MSDLSQHRYVDLLSLKVPSWGGSLVSNFRHAARIPKEISDLLVFVAIEEARVCTYDEEADKIGALRDALGLPELEQV